MEKAEPVGSRLLGAAFTDPPPVTIVSGSKLHALLSMALPSAEAPVKFTVPKSVSGSSRQLFAHSDGASAIHSAELNDGSRPSGVVRVNGLFPPPERVSAKLSPPADRTSAV